MVTAKIALVGGPCGGKTSSISFIVGELEKHGISVKTVDETASLLFDLGFAPGTNISIFDFQNLLLKIQFMKEYISEGKSKVLLCDRGIFDSKVYIGNEEFKQILLLNKLDETEISSTYDGALYFRSISHEYPNEFAIQRIYETPEIGAMRDELSEDIWSNFIIPCEYSNLDGFENKQNVLCSTLIDCLGTLDLTRMRNLSDYYDSNHCNFIYNGINDILDKNEFDGDVKIKIRSLIK